MLQSTRIKEREHVTQRLLKKRYWKENPKMLTNAYKKNDEKQGNLEKTQKKKQKRP